LSQLGFADPNINNAAQLRASLPHRVSLRLQPSRRMRYDLFQFYFEYLKITSSSPPQIVVSFTNAIRLVFLNINNAAQLRASLPHRVYLRLNPSRPPPSPPASPLPRASVAVHSRATMCSTMTTRRERVNINTFDARPSLITAPWWRCDVGQPRFLIHFGASTSSLV
jgi:hypothetical protein